MRGFSFFAQPCGYARKTPSKTREDFKAFGKDNSNRCRGAREETILNDITKLRKFQRYSTLKLVETAIAIFEI
jgi:hypothetical protein